MDRIEVPLHVHISQYLLSQTRKKEEGKELFVVASVCDLVHMQKLEIAAAVLSKQQLGCGELYTRISSS